MDKIDFIQNVSTSFKVKYNNNPAIISTAPGRINLIGEHTDYNNGLAMPIAINRWVTSCLSKSKRRSFSVFSINYGKTVDIKNKATTIRTKGRHDPCVGIRAVPIAEAMMALTLCDLYLRHKAQNL